MLYNQPAAKVKPFLKALKSEFKGELKSIEADLSSPIHFSDIYESFEAALKVATNSYPGSELFIQLSSGTPAMTAVSILVGKSMYNAQFIQSSIEQGVQFAEIPFDIAADFLPSLVLKKDKDLQHLMSGVAPENAEFDSIITQNPAMKRVKQKAAILAQRNVPVLIYGETGTGKELLAKAIRNSSSRAGKPFLVINCGAIPNDLIDSTLFGHAKGAFTGANAVHKGFFEQADGGTLFLDEFGELPLESQVRLLRVLQDGTYTRVGDPQERKTDVRIIAATNKNLMDEIAAGRFREDLFYRVAIGVLQLPPLRDRKGDLGLLADALLEQINKDAVTQPGYISKKISAKARKLILSSPWLGNVRDLHATLLRASLWQIGDTLTDKDVQEAMINTPSPVEGVLNRNIDQGIDINEIIGDVCRHYIDRALQETNGSKTKAAELLNLKNYQTLNNWMEKYGIN